MAINLYTGVMGSGKSYECVITVIVPAIAAGRRCVTNIHGVNEEKIHEYIRKRKLAAEGAILGTVLYVQDARITEPAFFPDETKPDQESVVQPGDLIVVDEAWRFWSTGVKLPDEHMQFFRMHRHYVHPETKLSCDMALIFQSVTDVHRSLRSVAELTIRTVKLKSFGLSSKYKVELFGGDKVNARNRISTSVRTYQKSIKLSISTRGFGPFFSTGGGSMSNAFWYLFFAFWGVVCAAIVIQNFR